MNIQRVAALFLAVGILVAIWCTGFGVSSASPRSIAVVVIAPWLFVLVSHRPGEVALAFRDAFARDHGATPVERLEAGRSALDALGRYSLAVGVVGVFWGLIASFNAMTALGANGTPRAMAPLVGQALFLPAFGGFLRWFVYAPLAAALRSSAEVV